MMYNIIKKLRKLNKGGKNMAICYATMKNSHGMFIYKLERENYTLLDFDKEFKEIAKNRGWLYIECGTTKV